MILVSGQGDVQSGKGAEKLIQSVFIGNAEVSPYKPCVVGNVGRTQCAIEVEKQGADIVEFRCDLVTPSTLRELTARAREIRAKVSLPIIATIRKTIDGGSWYKFQRSDEERLPIFKKMLPFANAVDIEYNSVIKHDVTRLCREHKLPVIHSHHNFLMTPTKVEIKDLLSRMCDGDCDIVKMAFMVKHKDDFKTLLFLLCDYIENKASTKPLTLIPMGIHGRPGRFIFPWFGSCLTYGCVTKEKAPSQPFVKELVHYLNEASKITTLPIRETSEGQKALMQLSKITKVA